MLNKSHTKTEPHQIAHFLLTLLTVWLALAPSGAGAFSFGRHRQSNTREASQQSDGRKDEKQDENPETAGIEPAAVKADEALPLTTGGAKPAGGADEEPTKQSKGPKIIRRRDLSGQFGYVLPEGWRSHQIPFQTHDALSTREKDDTLATISFADELGKNSLEKIKDSTVENSKRILQKYELVDSKMLSLPNGQPCAIIVSLAQIDQVDTRQVQYILNLKKKHYLIVTLTTTKPVGEKYDKLLLEVVTSISVKANL